MNEEDYKKVIQNIVDFFRVFQEEIIDMFPDNNPEISPLLLRALHEIYFDKYITPSLLSKRLAITVPNTSRCLQQLVEAEYIVKIKDENDKRISHIMLTEKGMVTIEKHIKDLDDLVLKKISVLEEEELIEFSNAFCTIRKMLKKVSKTN